jgi:hypothetical protein
MTVFIRPEFTPGTLLTFNGYHLQIFAAGRAKISLRTLINNKKHEFYTGAVVERLSVCVTSIVQFSISHKIFWCYFGECKALKERAYFQNDATFSECGNCRIGLLGTAGVTSERASRGGCRRT